MTLSSMTGFASDAGNMAEFAWVWELKSVNGKSLDVKLRMPQGYDHLETQCRNTIMQSFKRGNIQAALSISGSKPQEKFAINHDILGQYLTVAKELHQLMGGEAPRADNLLAMRGVLEVTAEPIDDTEQQSRDAALLASMNRAIASLNTARRDEGHKLSQILSAQVNNISNLTKLAADNPARSIENIKQRLNEQIARLLEVNTSFDQDRLHQEAVLIATKADIQEEIDRLNAHVASARELLVGKEPVGRKLDFLAQEFNREANTLCSKAADKSMSAIGLELKTVIDQLREQVQNIE